MAAWITIETRPSARRADLVRPVGKCNRSRGHTRLGGGEERPAETGSQQAKKVPRFAARAEIGAIDNALIRLREGQYGICESCGEPILHGRLKASPWTTLCRTCA